MEVATRSAKGLEARIRRASFPVSKDFDTFDFTAVPSVPKQKVLELSRGEWIDQHFNCCLVGQPGTGKRTWPRPWAWPRAGKGDACGSSRRRRW